jgi:pimeloyl-ACP methyl ester carboxylesterase
VPHRSGDPADAFDLVVPSLPGYGFSGKANKPGMNAARTADLWAKLMTDVLGYQRFGAQGGDWGALVTTALGYRHPKHVAGIHLNMVLSRVIAGVADLTDKEKQWLAEVEAWRKDESAYSQIQGTKPQTLAYGLNDSPAGLCAWIVEKFRTWSDCGGDVERRFSKDHLLTNVMLYWVTQSIGSSVRYYYENSHSPPVVPPGKRVEAPTGIAVFPKEIIKAPRSMAERMFNITRWTEMKAGGHFAALEEPQPFVEDVRAFFRSVRG